MALAVVPVLLAVAFYGRGTGHGEVQPVEVHEAAVGERRLGENARSFPTAPAAVR